MAADKFITRSKAFARVSKALLSQLSEHIRPPTTTENELLEEFGHGPVYQPGTRFLGGAGYNPFAKIEQGEDYAAVQDAQRRHRDWKWHCEKVDDWISARGFDGKHLDLTAFEKAFDTCFAIAAVGTDPQSAPARPFDLSVARPFGGSNPSRRDDRISDPIPDDGIGLAEARKKWLRALVPNFDALDEKAEHAIQERLKGERVFEADQALQAVANEQAAEHLKADIIVRKALIAGEITGLILNDRGDRLKLAAADWVVDSANDSHRDAYGTMVSVEVPNAGFAAADDYVWPGAVERSGPDTRLSGSSRPNAHRRVFFQQRDFAALLEQHVLDDEPPALQRSGLMKKSAKEKETDALEIARKFVADGVAPNYKDHATQVMQELKTKYPNNHIRREDLELLLQANFKRREPGQKANKRTR